MRALKRVPNENQFSAMVSMAYNVGIEAFTGSSVARLFNAGNVQGAADAFRLWVKGTIKGQKVTLPGLVKRREAERQLFLRPVVASPVTDEPAKEPARNWLTVLIETLLSIFRSRK
jgi:GH24 family phage-related lysozyme (muramidase)